MPRSRAIKFGLCLFPLILTAKSAQETDGFESLIRAGKYAEAHQTLQSYVAGHPNSWQALYQLGYVDFRLHRLQDSLTMLCKSILLKKDFSESHKILAYDLNMLGHPELAKPELERAIQYDPSSHESHYELGRIDYEQGSYAAAVAELEKAKLLDPTQVHTYHNLGLAYSALNNRALAVQNFDEGLRLNDRQAQRSAWPLIDYATYLNTQREFEKARDLLLQAIAIDKSWDQEFEELSKSYRGLNQITEAIDALKKAVALNPGKPEPHYVLSRLYAQVQRQQDAQTELTLYQRARQAGSNASNEPVTKEH